MIDRNGQIRIIGIGNPLMGDDGIGIAAIEQLQQEQLPPNVELIDGGCGGLNLLPLLAECQQALIIDAADFGAPPGTIKILNNADLDQIPPQPNRLSSHQPGLAEILFFSKKLRQLPKLNLIFMQAISVGSSSALSPQVMVYLPNLKQKILDCLFQNPANP